ncbi:orotate phosphoribosyltransferase [Salinibacillus xinjiangensis]|uniref:Orotate phosphoribosyltransferase n=1 Tax=Salinibacillus xinjiangensis TaxID=1229268 RepID=A0A6G1X3A4_9BACI|nr:orotate phosphoribosyltransferase [Salinibacillus xinjiangensis]MRG85461.1 orotate phosphoribosyltransferase [Salinibacillus xinjiangensis]
MSRKSIVARKLLEIGALQVSPNDPFTWSSGIESPIYCDNRIVMSFPKVRAEIAKYFAEVIKEHYPETEVIAGCATAGIPHAAWVAEELNLPMVYVRGKAKSHGKQNQIEGIIKTGQKVIVIEDLISTGMSSIQSAKAIQAAGGKVVSVLSIFTYGLTLTEENFSKSQLCFESLTDFDTLLTLMSNKNQIHNEEHSQLLAWRNQLTFAQKT